MASNQIPGAAVAAANRRRWSDPDFREKMAAAAAERWKDPDYRRRITESLQRKWDEPAYRARMLGIIRRIRRPSALPPRDSKEFKQYCKLRNVLGAKAAREAMGIESGRWLRTQAHEGAGA